MTNHQTDHPSDLLPGFALGILDLAELQLVETHLADCPACRAEAAELQETVGYFALAAPEVDPSPDLRGRLHDQIAGASPVETGAGPTAEDNGVLQVVPHQPSQPTPIPWLQRIIPVAAQGPVRRPLWQLATVALIVAVIATNFLWWQQLNRVQAPPVPGEMLAISLTGTSAVPDAAGFLMVSSDGLSGAIVVDEFPIIGEEQAYQLWLIRDGQRDSAAVFSVDELGYGGARVRAPQSLFVYDSAEITLEPAEGSPYPTGERILEGLLFAP